MKFEKPFFFGQPKKLLHILFKDTDNINFNDVVCSYSHAHIQIQTNMQNTQGHLFYPKIKKKNQGHLAFRPGPP